MPKMRGISRPVIIGCFFHSFPVRLTLAFIEVKSCDLSATLAIEIGFVPTCLDGISVHCELVSTKALYFCG